MALGCVLFPCIVHNPLMPALDNQPFTLPWRNRYAALGLDFLSPVAPTPLPDLHWVAQNTALASDMGLPASFWNDPQVLAALGGSATLDGSMPLASVYSGHQFGVWAGQLGDGRALWLGEIDTPMGPQELQLKGAGKTPYSRMGDGRAVLRSSIREYLCSEAMHALGIPTTRALALVGSPAKVIREELETAAVVTRVAPSFLRFGHLEHFAAKGQIQQLQSLVDFFIAHQWPDLQSFDAGPARYTALLARVSERTAALLAQWQSVGFCHGVMNTDNMSLLGLTIDYGPFQFLDGFDPSHICNHSDHQGRYAYARQPQIAFWNLYCLGQALMPLINDQDLAVSALEGFKTDYPQSLDQQFAAKLGLQQRQSTDHDLIHSLLTLLATEKTDFTIFWRRLSHAVADLASMSTAVAFTPVRDLFIQHGAWDAWLPDYLQRLEPQNAAQTGQQMLNTNPKFVLRNHLGEAAINQAKIGDFSGVQTLFTLLSSPFEEHPGFDDFAAFPPDWASSISISCSS
jgi:uncharacterized protein YdiU (UPF0061 family)